MPFVHSFVEQLRGTDWEKSVDFAGWAQELADHLEWRVNTPQNDGFDLQVTEDDEQDRAALAVWLDAAEHAPPFLAPSWGRTFSGAIAWLLRNNHGLSFENVLVACVAKGNDPLAEVVRDKGIQTAYERLTARRPR